MYFLWFLKITPHNNALHISRVSFHHSRQHQVLHSYLRLPVPALRSFQFLLFLLIVQFRHW
ncbi:hypothetical protein Hanom_Chr04g00308831 [Helianthus anomalus]